jgi:hypothetical protein
MINIKNNSKNYYVIQETNKFSKLSYQRVGRWVVTMSKPKPAFPLGRGTTLINAPISIVSKRIDEYLRINSIEALFDVDNAEATCKTGDGLQYKVFLYAGPENDDRSTTYVEVMKMKGCGFQFGKEKETIFNAAKASQTRQEKPMNELMTTPPDLLKSYVPPSIYDLESMLDRLIGQLNSLNHKVLLFALQNLASMTTPDKSYHQSAHQMSRLFMQNQNDVRDMIISLYTTAVSTPHDMINDNSEEVRSLCLHILINGMQSFYNTRCNTDNDKILDQQTEDIKNFFKQLIPSLLKAVKNYRDTHNAYLALTALCILIKHSPASCFMLRERNTITVIEEAELYGGIEHLKLEIIARHTKESLQIQPTPCS